MTPAGPIIIAIDGPAAAGKGTLARRLAAALNLPHLDTGLLYRAVARRVLNENQAGGESLGGKPDAAIAAARMLTPADLARPDLRGPEIDAASSAVAAIPGVRSALLEFQRAFPGQTGAVLDGRDIGTVIFPDATVKLFVTASLAARAHRRWLELRARGIDCTIEHVEEEMGVRDAQDAARAAAPLRPAPDAIIIDTTESGADEVFKRARALINQRLHEGANG